MRPHTILIYPDLAYSELQRPAPPYSILFLADSLQKANIDVDLFDTRYDSIDKVVKAVLRYEPTYVGISIMTGPQIQNALHIAAAIRQAIPNTTLVWGGIHSTILPEQTLRHPLVDLVIRGDGERAFTQLVQGTPLTRIQGVVFQQDNQIFQNGLAPPTKMTEVQIPWNLIDAQRYVERGRTSIITSRGCPYRCAFCYNAILQTPWRGWTVKQCINELNQLLALGAEDVLFFDDAFFTNLSRVQKLFPYFRKEKLTWIAELRVDKLTQDLARDAHQAGCQGFFFGAESGSKRILQLLNKGITVHQILRSAQITHEEQLGADYSWMVGIPTETKRDRRMTLAIIKAIRQRNPSAEFSIKIYTPYPQTPLYRLAREEGAKMPRALNGWTKLSRFRAAQYLRDRRRLETLVVTSTILGRRLFQKSRSPLALLRSLAQLRWRNEYFGLAWESLAFGLLSRSIESPQKSRVSQILQRLAKHLFPSPREETFTR